MRACWETGTATRTVWSKSSEISSVCGVCANDRMWSRSEEHTSELQSQSNLVCRLLLEKKKKQLGPDGWYVNIYLGSICNDTSRSFNTPGIQTRTLDTHGNLKHGITCFRYTCIQHKTL